MSDIADLPLVRYVLGSGYFRGAPGLAVLEPVVVGDVLVFEAVVLCRPE
jgi:hypothetical protein